MEVMFYVYVLRSKRSGKRYVGQTNHLMKRLIDHNSGNSRYTKTGVPWILVYTEEYSTRSEAMIREKFLKTGRGRDLLDNLGK